MAKRQSTATTESTQERAGAKAFVALLQELKRLREEELNSLDASDQPLVQTNWPTIVDRLQASIDANLRRAEPLHRQGYLRALADLLAINIDGGGIDDGWTAGEALRNTRGGFEAITSQRTGAG